MAEADKVEQQVRTVRDSGPLDARRLAAIDAIEQLLQMVRQAARPRGWLHWRGPVDRWRGTSVDRAYLSLHAAKIALVDLLPTEDLDALIPCVTAKLARLLPDDDPRRHYVDRLPALSPERRRAAVKQAMEIGYDTADALYARLRAFRNVLLVAAALIGILMAVLVLAAWQFPDAIPLCFTSSVAVEQPSPGITTRTACPGGDDRGPGSLDLGIVAGLGMLGGALAAPSALRGLRGSSIPYGIPSALITLKVVTGPLTAIAGLLLVSAKFVPGLYPDSQRQILAYALIFGYAQQFATRFVDKQAQSVIDEVSGQVAPSRRAAMPDAATMERLLARVPAAVSDGVQEALRGPPLVNYDGWVSVAVLDHGRRLELSDDREVELYPSRQYEVVVTIGPEQVAPLAEQLVVTEGIDRSTIEFAVEMDSDQAPLRRARVPVLLSPHSGLGLARFFLDVGDGRYESPPWLWIRVSQGRRTLQNLAIMARIETTRERG